MRSDLKAGAKGGDLIGAGSQVDLLNGYDCMFSDIRYISVKVASQPGSTEFLWDEGVEIPVKGKLGWRSEIRIVEAVMWPFS